jgi:hypothetical protein
VTETNFGASGSSRFTARHSVSSISGVFGGKNSKETLNGTARLSGTAMEDRRWKIDNRNKNARGDEAARAGALAEY